MLRHMCGEDLRKEANGKWDIQEFLEKSSGCVGWLVAGAGEPVDLHAVSWTGVKS